MSVTAAADRVLAAVDLSVELGGLPVLRGIGLELVQGEVIALLGGNGSGKSTLVRALLGLVPRQRGEVRLFGTPLERFAQWRRIGYVPQRSMVALGNAKVREVVAAGRLARRRPFVPARAADRAAVTEALATVELAERGGDQMATLSGGQQQRVLIARALAGTPELLVLDEPSAGVDLLHQRQLTAVLSRLIRAGTAVLVVLHEVGALAPLVDRAVVLREGRIIHEGALGSLGSADHIGGGHEELAAEPPRSMLHGAIER
jgi:zinc transport system ATP-binding protein